MTDLPTAGAEDACWLEDEFERIGEVADDEDAAWPPTLVERALDRLTTRARFRDANWSHTRSYEFTCQEIVAEIRLMRTMGVL